MWYVEEVTDVPRDLHLTHVSTLEIAGINAPAKTRHDCEEAGKEVGIRVLFNKRDRCAKLDSDELLVVSWAWNSNSLPGNEYWSGYLDDSDDPLLRVSLLAPSFTTRDEKTGRHVDKVTQHLRPTLRRAWLLNFLLAAPTFFALYCMLLMIFDSAARCCAASFVCFGLAAAITSWAGPASPPHVGALEDREATLASRSINNNIALKILPLGASIVWGEDSTDGNGFRLYLRDLLEGGGNTNVTYVGTVHHGNMSNNACEAYPGHTIDEVEQLALQSGVYAYSPNVVLVHLGTNDCLRAANETSAQAADRFSGLLATIKQHDPDALVVASTLIRNRIPEVDACITAFNARLPAIVQQANSGAQNVLLVDMHDAVPFSDINTTDKTHPNDAGYAIMARVWHSGLVNASALLNQPDATGKAAPPDRKSSGTHHTCSYLGSLVFAIALGWALAC